MSNFTSTLDLVAVLVQRRGYGYLRLDGSTPVDIRQHLVDRFNRTTDCTPIFLLSSRAGGVGINLYVLYIFELSLLFYVESELIY